MFTLKQSYFRGLDEYKCNFDRPQNAIKPIRSPNYKKVSLDTRHKEQQKFNTPIKPSKFLSPL